jgi:uroporphyrinogen decarboxylase
VVVSIGPTTSEWIRDNGLIVDLEPDHSKMGQLVVHAAQFAHETLQRKQRIHHMLSGPMSDALDKNAPWYDSLFLKACRGEPTDVTPVWLMRQAGRYMQEYREIRSKTTFLELCKSPELCSEIMVTAVNRLGVDAAIIFSDLLPILEPMGLNLEFAKGEGPVIHNPIREAADIDRVVELESVESLDFVMETVKLTRQELPADIPLIGFSGAPFTLASYAIEGGSSRNYLNTKTIMYRDPGAWKELMGRFVRAITRYLNAQIAAGVQCVQLFDSWAGCLGTDDYREYVLPYVQEIIAGLVPGIPVINFATGNPGLLPMLAEGGNCVVGVDWRIRLDDAWDIIGHDRSVQGNLDPLVLLADVPTIRKRTEMVLAQANGRNGHIFNLGHGVLQQTPVDNVIALVDAVHEISSR